MKNVILVLLFFPFGSGLLAQNYMGDPQEIKAILQKVTQFSQQVMASDYDQIAAAYTQDAKIFPGGSDIIEGQAPIRKYWVLPTDMEISYHKVSPQEIKIIGEEAYDYGYYEGKTRMENGEESSWKGKYVIVWKKEAGEWKIYLDIWNQIKDK